MKHILIMLALAILLGATNQAGAQSYRSYHYVNPYYRNNGSFVMPHYQTNPNGNPYDNWSSRPNVNPFTGRAGTIDPGYYMRPRVYNPYGY